MKIDITPEIEEIIRNQLFWIDNEDKIRISLSNYRLDFKKDYYFEKFSKKSMILYYLNGYDRIYVRGKVEYNELYNDYILYTENRNYSKNIEMKGGKKQNENIR